MRGIVLLVDDHARARKLLAAELEGAGYAVVQAGSGSEGWRLFCRHRPDVVVTDLVMPRGDGLDLLRRIRVRSDVPVLLFTARGSLQHAAAAIKAGADEVVASDEAGVDALVETVDRLRAGRDPEPTPGGIDTRLVGASPAMQRVRERVAALAPLRTPVLVQGEPGSGRDATVRCLHDLGATGGEDFERIDCAQIDPDRKLPPTGAIHLAGVEQLAPDAQALWKARLRGETRALDHLRLFATTEGMITEAVQSGALDAELAAQLGRFAIVLPPLRERVEDVPSIAESLVQRIGSEIGRRVRLSAAAKGALAEQPWPGNVAELSRVLERCVAFTRRDTIRVQLIEEVLDEHRPSVSGIRSKKLAEERATLIDAIERTGGNVSQAARLLGRSRGALYRLIEKHGIALGGVRP